MATFHIEPQKVELQIKRIDDMVLQITEVQKKVADTANGLSGIGLAQVGPNILAIEARLQKHKIKVQSISDALKRISMRYRFAEASIQAEVLQFIIEQVVSGVETGLGALFVDIQGILDGFNALTPPLGTIGNWMEDAMQPVIDFMDDWQQNLITLIDNQIIPGVNPQSLIEGEYINIIPGVPVRTTFELEIPFELEIDDTSPDIDDLIYMPTDIWDNEQQTSNEPDMEPMHGHMERVEITIGTTDTRQFRNVNDSDTRRFDDLLFKEERYWYNS